MPFIEKITFAPLYYKYHLCISQVTIIHFTELRSVDIAAPQNKSKRGSQYKSVTWGKNTERTNTF